MIAEPETVAEVEGTARLYYEAHITTAPLTQTQRENLEPAIMVLGFKLADFLMQRGADGLDHKAQDPNSFVSCRDTDKKRIYARTFSMVRTFHAEGVEVRRYKIEDTLADSKHDGDFLKTGRLKTTESVS